MQPLSYGICQRRPKEMSEVREALQPKAVASRKSSAEAQYSSSMVSELYQYTRENLTSHDYILRMALDSNEQVQLMKQVLQMLLDIFAT
jgi:hypothetical protein